MSDNNRRREGDLVLPYGTFAHILDITTGVVKTHLGPTTVSRGGQDQPVIYDYDEKGYIEVDYDKATQQCITVPQGFYAQLWNPTENGNHPTEKSAGAQKLRMGQRINIPGPVNFALWPGQSAKVIPGHRLQSNQYLQVRVYDADAARENLKDAVFEAADDGKQEGEKAKKKEKSKRRNAFAGIDPDSLSAGQILIIKGTDVSFFIPPTGMEVIAEKEYRGSGHKDKYVRDAQTLEALQYCILVDENGSKRYPKGPEVVFPKATEEFFIKKDERGNPVRVFQAIELDEISGIHIKVIAPYEGEYTNPETGETEEKHKFNEGDEFFITNCIYYPREEHSVVKYDGRTKHFATAIPEGDGRYVMNRKSGEIRLVEGPKMLLPNPVHDVIVQRVLSERESSDWYPGNEESLAFNRMLQEEAAGESGASEVLAAGGASLSYGAERGWNSNALRNRGFAGATSHVSKNTDAVMTTSERGTTYTKPRKIIFGDKFEGVPTIAPHPGFAVMVVDKAGNRRVIVGPQSYLMGYSETLRVLELSTGKPKNTDRKQRTVYLKYEHNRVSDIINIVTADHVEVDVKLSYQVNFEGLDDQEAMAKWFSVDNYVKFMCDRMRSILKAYARKTDIVDFYGSPEDRIRDVVLGEKDENSERPGKFFEENNMHIYDVEVLNVEIKDGKIRELLERQQLETFTSTIEIQNAERELATTKKLEAAKRERQSELAKSTQHRADLRIEEISRSLQIAIEELAVKIQTEEHRLKLQNVQDSIEDARNTATLERKRARADLDAEIEKISRDGKIIWLQKETEAVTQRFGAFDQNLTNALLQLQDADTLEAVARALSVQNLIGGESVAETINMMFKGTGLEQVAENLTKRLKDNGVNHSSRPRA